MAEEHVGQVLDRWAEQAPDRPALVEPSGRTVTFGALKHRVERLAGAFRREGLRPGDRVVLLVPMGIDLYEVLLALFWSGAAAVLVDPQAGVPRIRHSLGRIGVHGLIGSPKAHLLRIVVPALRGGRLYAATGPSFPRARQLATLDADPLPRTLPPEGEPALITFTTGTTGDPKAIGRSHRFLLAQHRVLAGHMGLGPDDVDLPTLPVFLLNSLGAGATCVLPDADLRDVGAVDPDRVIAQLAGVTTSSGSPAFFRPIVDRLLERGETLPLRKLFLGGARVPASLLADVVRVFPQARVEVVYGSTEAEPITTIDAGTVLGETAARESEGACVGRPVPGITVRLVDDEVQVAGEHVNPGYYRDPAANQDNKVREGDRVWHRTGDAAWIDDVGRLWLVGRVGERIGGRWPFPTEAGAEAVAGVRKAGLVDVDGPVLAFCGDADPSVVAAAIGMERVVRVEEIPVDPRHRAKVDRPALTRLVARATF